MTIREARKLGINDQFRRASTNPHDGGWRVYRVIALNLEYDKLIAVDIQDQHGYQTRIRIPSDREFLKQCE